jgi:hypothetical protein
MTKEAMLETIRSPVLSMRALDFGFDSSFVLALTRQSTRIRSSREVFCDLGTGGAKGVME